MKPVLTQQFSDNVSEVEFGNEKQQGNEIPVVIREEIAHIAAESTVEANRAAMAFGAGFTMLGFLVSFALPKRAKEDEEEEIEEMIELGLVSQTEIDNQPSPVHTRLTIDLIGELILIEQARLERGYPSIHAEVRALVDRLKA